MINTKFQVSILASLDDKKNLGQKMQMGAHHKPNNCVWLWGHKDE
jgi:hypothetical protein